MTDRIKEYRKILEESDPDELEKPTREMACEWIDSQIEYCKKWDELQREYLFPLAYGKLLPDEGEYETEIAYSIYGSPSVLYGVNPTLTIYKGIESLAEIMGEELKMCKHSDSFPYCYWFRYGKYIIDQIEQYELKGVKCECEDYHK